MNASQNWFSFAAQFTSLFRSAALLVVTTSFLSPSTSRATPIKLAFDAVVGPPRQGVEGFVPPSLGVSLAPGDTVSGSFTFEPVDVASNVNQTTVIEPLRFNIHIGFQTLTSSMYYIGVSDNSHPSDVDPYDGIEFGCSFPGGTAACAPNQVAPADPTYWASILNLYGSTTVLSGADIPSDPQTWQEFNDNFMVVTFFDPVQSRYFGFQATPQGFRQIPEPNAALLMILGGTCALVARRRSLWEYLYRRAECDRGLCRHNSGVVRRS
jgi:hypothetical protein